MALYSVVAPDEQLKSNLECYVLANYSSQEILGFATRDYPEYAWSLPTLSRRFFFGIKCIRYNIEELEEVKKAVLEELEGPGQYLGYRAMQRKLREQHKLAVPRSLVYDVMSLVSICVVEVCLLNNCTSPSGSTGVFHAQPPPPH